MAVSRSCARYVLVIQVVWFVFHLVAGNGLSPDMSLTRLKITTSLGQPANLDCYANQTNTTSLTYSWTKDNLTVTQSSNIKAYGNVLVVTPKKESDFGMYECHVTDGVAMMKCKITLMLGCNNTAHKDNPQGTVGFANISVLMPVLAIVIFSLLLNIHFFVRWKRRDRWVPSEEEIMQLLEAQEPFSSEDSTGEPVEVKKKKLLFRRLRREKYENDDHIQENEKNSQGTVCDRDTRGKHKEELIEMIQIQVIPSVANIKAVEEDIHLDEVRRPAEAEVLRIADFFQTKDEGRDDSGSESSGTPRRPAVVKVPRIADFLTTTDEETDDTAHVPPDTSRSSTVAEPPRIADFFVPDGETDGESSGCESVGSEHPLVSHYVERMDFQGKDDSDDEPFLK